MYVCEQCSDQMGKCSGHFEESSRWGNYKLVCTLVSTETIGCSFTLTLIMHIIQYHMYAMPCKLYDKGIFWVRLFKYFPF